MFSQTKIISMLRDRMCQDNEHQLEFISNLKEQIIYLRKEIDHKTFVIESLLPDHNNKKVNDIPASLPVTNDISLMSLMPIMTTCHRRSFSIETISSLITVISEWILETNY